MSTPRTARLRRGVAATTIGLILGSGAIAPLTATAAPAQTPTGTAAGDQRSVTPTAVQNLTAVSEDGEVLLSWDPPANIAEAPVTNYEITVTSKDGYKKNSYTNDPTMTAWGLENGTEYTVSVRAISFPNVGPSTVVRTTPAPLPPKAQLTSTTTVSATTTGAVTRVSGTVMASDGVSTTPATGWVRATWKCPDGTTQGLLMKLDENGHYSEQYEEGYNVEPRVEAVYLGDSTRTTEIAGSTGTTVMRYQPDPGLFPVRPAPGPAPINAAPQAPAKPQAAVKAKAVKSKSKLHIDVNPDMGKKTWNLTVQKQAKDGSWKTVKKTTSKGSAETRTVNLPKGTYRVVVGDGHGYSSTTSAPVTLKR